MSNGFDNMFCNVAETINKVILSKNWQWFKNVDCKYIEVRIDTRSGECQIKNRDGKIISMEDMLKQYESTIHSISESMCSLSEEERVEYSKVVEALYQSTGIKIDFTNTKGWRNVE